MGILRIGTAGIPASTKPVSSLNAIKRLAELGLKHMELEFVRGGVKMGKNTALAIRRRAEKYDISLTVHAPYYVNLNSAEPEKVEASKIISYAQHRLGGPGRGGTSVTFHAAYYHDDDPEEVYLRVRQNLAEIQQMLKVEGITIRLSPETTGGGWRSLAHWKNWYVWAWIYPVFIPVWISPIFMPAVLVDSILMRNLAVPFV